MRPGTRWIALLLCLTTVAVMPACRGRAARARAANQNPTAAARPTAAEAAAAVGRAQSLRRQGLYEPALAELRRAIHINPKLTTAFVSMGDIHREMGDFGDAETAYSRAASVEPQNFDAQYLHGLALQLLDRLVDSVRAYLRALTIRPDDFNANLNLATAYLQLAEPRQALAYAQRAVQLRTDSAAARVNLGAVYAALEQHEDAVVEYRQAAELMRLTPELLLNLAESLGKAGRNAEMQTTLEQLVRTKPSAVAYERLGSCLYRQEKYDDAVAAFRKAIEIDDAHFPAHNGVGVCLLNRYIWSERTDTKAKEEGLTHLRRSLQIERRQPQIIELISRYG
ncbi:MAG: tetratricopeptide repeat protein [Phycisphaerales bacterium]